MSFFGVVPRMLDILAGRVLDQANGQVAVPTLRFDGSLRVRCSNARCRSRVSILFLESRSAHNASFGCTSFDLAINDQSGLFVAIGEVIVLLTIKLSLRWFGQVALTKAMQEAGSVSG